MWPGLLPETQAVTLRSALRHDGETIGKLNSCNFLRDNLIDWNCKMGQCAGVADPFPLVNKK